MVSRLVLRLWMGVLAVWLLVSSAPAQVTIPTFPATVLHLDVSPDNQWIAVSTSRGWGTSLLYSLSDRRLVRACVGMRPVFVGNRLLALDTADGVVLRDVPSWRPVWRLPTSGQLQASRDGRWLLVHRRTWTAGDIAELWQVAPPQRRLSLALPSGSTVALSADGRFVFQTVPTGATSTEVVVRSTANGQVTRRFVVDIRGIFAVSPNGDRVAFADPLQVKVYQVADAQLLYRFIETGSLSFTHLRFSPDGNYLAGGYGIDFGHGAWRLWRLTDGALVAGETYPYTPSDEVWTLGFSGDGSTLYIAFPHRILLVDAGSGQTLDEWRSSAWEVVLGFLSGEEEFALADEQSVRFYACVDGALTRKVDLPPSGVPPFGAALSGDGSTYAVYSSYGNGITLFRLPPGGAAQPILTLPLWPNSPIDEPMALRLSEDGSSLFVGDSSGSVHWIRVLDGTVSTLAEGVSETLFDITPDGSLLVTVGQEIRVQRVSDGATLYTLPQAQWLGVAQDGRGLAVVRKERPYPQLYRLSLYDLPTGALLREVLLLLSGGTSEPEVRVSPDARVIVATWRGFSVTERRTEIYRWDEPSPRLITLWRGVTAPSQPVFSRLGRYVAIDRVVQRGFSNLVGVQGRVILDGWSGVFPEHLRYTLRDALTGAVLDAGDLHLTETEGMVGRFILPVPVDRSPETLALTVEGRPFLRRTLRVSEILEGWPPKPVDLLTGDVDGDNEVNLLDFSRVVAAFGSFAGDADYDIDADLDGDGEISLWDFGWLVSHLGLAGDE